MGARIRCIFNFGRSLPQGKYAAMLIAQSKQDLEWDALDVPMASIDRDWYGVALDVPAAYALVLDPSCLWFLASRARPASPSPQAGPGEFVAGLWQHDVAEFFLHDPGSGRYLEFNLAPNGAWWSAGFVAPRVPEPGGELRIPGVQTYSRTSAAGHWLVAASMPLDFLRQHYAFGTHSRMNVTFILDSPEQTFLSANPPVEGEPDFHRLDLFSTVEFRPDLSV